MNHTERKEAVLKMADQSIMGISMLVLSMLSDVQEAIATGHLHLANDIVNDVKIIVDNRLAKKDEHGRHI